jgi:hypothetical protein
LSLFAACTAVIALPFIQQSRWGVKHQVIASHIPVSSLLKDQPASPNDEIQGSDTVNARSMSCLIICSLSFTGAQFKVLWDTISGQEPNQPQIVQSLDCTSVSGECQRVRMTSQSQPLNIMLSLRIGKQQLNSTMSAHCSCWIQLIAQT